MKVDARNCVYFFYIIIMNNYKKKRIRINSGKI